jgi:hypothetical protein
MGVIADSLEQMLTNDPHASVSVTIAFYRLPTPSGIKVLRSYFLPVTKYLEEKRIRYDQLYAGCALVATLTPGEISELEAKADEYHIQEIKENSAYDGMYAYSDGK